MKLLITLTFMALATGCSQTTEAFGARYQASTEDVVKGLRADMMEYDTVLPKERGERFRTENVLVKIHGWLSMGNGLMKNRLGNQTFLILRPIPQSVLKEIVQVTFPASDKEGRPTNTGLAILQQAFWRDLQRIQAEGVSVGFVIPNSDLLIGGIYYPDKKLIGVDIFANAGVLTHEYRHHRQHQRTDPRGTPNPRELGRQCIAGASQFFGELDATTEELKTWVGVFPAMEITPRSHETQTEGEEHVHFPQVGLLSGNLAYPERAYFQYVLPQDCPEEMHAVFRSIIKETGNVAGLLGDLASELYGLRMDNFFGWITLNTRCNQENLTEREKAYCNTTRAKVAGIPAEAQQIKDDLDAAFPKAEENRLDVMKTELAKLSADIQRDLCLYASGFEFRFPCNKYLNTFEAEKKKSSRWGFSKGWFR